MFDHHVGSARRERGTPPWLGVGREPAGGEPTASLQRAEIRGSRSAWRPKGAQWQRHPPGASCELELPPRSAPQDEESSPLPSRLAGSQRPHCSDEEK